VPLVCHIGRSRAVPERTTTVTSNLWLTRRLARLNASPDMPEVKIRGEPQEADDAPDQAGSAGSTVTL
jgi:hypothetical protein